MVRKAAEAYSFEIIILSCFHTGRRSSVPKKLIFTELTLVTKHIYFLFSHISFVFLWKALKSSDDLFHITETSYVFVWEPVSKQKRLLVPSQKQCFKFRIFFFYKETFMYSKNLEELKKHNLFAFFSVYFKDRIV